MAQRGFSVTACDIYAEAFQYHGRIPFVAIDLEQDWPLEHNTFDYVVCLEVIEHMTNPSQLIRRLADVLKPGGLLVLSTPNILSMKSRLRFLTEGAWEYFREPLLERAQVAYANPKEHFHIAPLRIHELEYFLHQATLDSQEFHTTKLYTGLQVAGYPLELLIRLQLFLKRQRATRRGEIRYDRISRILCSKPVLYGQHLVVLARKKKEKGK